MDNMDFARHDDYRPGLTAEERAAIEAFPAEKIQKVPTGESGDPFYLKWVPSTKVESNDGLSGGQIRMFHKETHERITKYQKAVVLKGKRKPPHKTSRRSNGSNPMHSAPSARKPHANRKPMPAESAATRQTPSMRAAASCMTSFSKWIA